MTRIVAARWGQKGKDMIQLQTFVMLKSFWQQPKLSTRRNCEGITMGVRHGLGTHRRRLLQTGAKTSAQVSKQFWSIFRIGSSTRCDICCLACCPKTRRWKPATNSSNGTSRYHSHKPPAFGRCSAASSFR